MKQTRSFAMKGSVSPLSNSELSERKLRSAGARVTNKVTRRPLTKSDIYESNSKSRIDSFEISIPRSVFSASLFEMVGDRADLRKRFSSSFLNELS